MREKKPALVITFSAATDAMATESYCESHGLPGRLIPVPREITAGCGLAWKAEPQERSRLETAFQEAGIRWQEMRILEMWS